MKRTALTLGALATVALPLTTTIACNEQQSSKYFYELIIDPVNHDGRSLNVHIFHLPTESDNGIGDDFREEYWRRLYSDLGRRLNEKKTTLVVDYLEVKYSSIDHVATGGYETWAVDLTAYDANSFGASIVIPEHIAQPGEYIYGTDEDGFVALVKAEVETIVPEREFWFQTLTQLFSDELKNFVDKDSLLITYPKTDSIPSERWDAYGYLVRILFQHHMKQI